MYLLEKFEDSFVNIVLSLVIALLISHILFPNVIGTSGVKSWDDGLLAIAVCIFLLKYLHESSISNIRFGKIHEYVYESCANTKSIHLFLLFLSMVLIPIISCLFVAYFLFKSDFKSGNDMHGAMPIFLGIGFLLLHSLLYLMPDKYINKYLQELKNANKGTSHTDPNGYSLEVTIKRWLKIDSFVLISTALIAGVIVFLIALTYYGFIRIEIKPKILAFMRCFIGGVMIVQTVVDYIWNQKYFFQPGRIPDYKS